MKTSSRALLAVGALTLVGFGACRALRHTDAGAAADPKLFFNRAWIERTPEKPTESVHAFFAFSRQAHGLFFQGSSWAGRFERFEYERKDNEVRLVFPQQNKKASFTYKVTTCNEKDGFDLCLDLSENPWGGPKRYYGATGDTDALPEGARDLAARLAASP